MLIRYHDEAGSIRTPHPQSKRSQYKKDAPSIAPRTRNQAKVHMSLMTVAGMVVMRSVYESIRIDGLTDPCRKIDAAMLPVWLMRKLRAGINRVCSHGKTQRRNFGVINLDTKLSEDQSYGPSILANKVATSEGVSSLHNSWNKTAPSFSSGLIFAQVLEMSL